MTYGRRVAGVMLAALALGTTCAAQNPPPAPAQPPEHDMSTMDMPMDMDMSGSGWHLMQDGSFYLMFNHQGGPRGGDEGRAPNWWMGMAGRKLGGGDLTLTGMFSLDAATVGSRGYREIFQVGEAYDGEPVVDRQHPHDFWMQLSAAWRVPVSGKTGMTLAGGISGEPALGPVAFMHRASAATVLLAPLGHHTFDSTHVSFGVATLGIDHGPVAVEASVFNGREPDQNRWNLDFGPMDSVSARLWYRPAPSWEFQVSSGRLVEPEELHPGNLIRTTASAAYLRGGDERMSAATVGFGMNAGDEVTRHAAFGEFTRTWGRAAASARLEFVEVETELLRTGSLPDTPEGEAQKDVVAAFTIGAQHDVARWRRLTAAFGANGTFHGVPSSLESSHGAHPFSFQLFLQIRPASGSMGRMWNMRMAGPTMNPGTVHQH